MLRNSATICGQNTNVDIEQLLHCQVQNLLEMLSDSKRPLSSKSASSVSSRSGNSRYQFTQPVYHNPKLEHLHNNTSGDRNDSETRNKPSSQFINSCSNIIFDHESSMQVESILPEGSADEDAALPVLESPSVTDSVCSTVVTSGIIGTDKTDWTSRLGTITCDTSDTESDWWDASHDKSRSGYTESHEDEEEDEEDDVSFVTSIRLNLENEDLPDDILREQRLAKHLQSMEKLKHNKGDFVERVISATGRRVGRWLDSTCMNEVKKSSSDHGQGAGKSKRHGIQLFSPNPESASQFDQPNQDSRRRRWDEMSITVSKPNLKYEKCNFCNCL